MIDLRKHASYSLRMYSIADIDIETERAARAFIEKLAGQYELAGAILFGSRARKSHRPGSDADVAVLLHGHPGKFVATKLAMADLAYDVLLETGIRIQPLPIWEEEWAHPETYSNPRLLHNIEREGIRL
jgi:predicted nucleotidyltransferase